MTDVYCISGQWKCNRVHEALILCQFYYGNLLKCESVQGFAFRQIINKH